MFPLNPLRDVIEEIVAFSFLLSERSLKMCILSDFLQELKVEKFLLSTPFFAKVVKSTNLTHSEDIENEEREERVRERFNSHKFHLIFF